MAGKYAARIGDKSQSFGHVHKCPMCTMGSPHNVIGPFVTGSPDVYINGRNVIRMGDPGVAAACCDTNMFKAKECSKTVFVNGLGVVQMGDITEHCQSPSYPGNVIGGSPDVLIG